MQTFYKVCLILMIIGGINWGLVGLFQFDFVGWLLGGSSSIWSRIVFTVVGVVGTLMVCEPVRLIWPLATVASPDRVASLLAALPSLAMVLDVSALSNE